MSENETVAAPLTPEQEAADKALRQTIKGFFMMPRKLRRETFRRYLKAMKVPRPTFPKISAMRNFRRLNFLTFLEDLTLAGNIKKEGPKDD